MPVDLGHEFSRRRDQEAPRQLGPQLGDGEGGSRVLLGPDQPFAELGLHRVLEGWAAKAGGTSGVLWGTALAAAGRRLGDHGTPTDIDVAEALRTGHDALIELGGAQRGDKTMLDALGPFVDAVESAVQGGTDWRCAWLAAVDVARKSAAATAELRPKVGRARPLAERSVGTPDAGAISLAMCIGQVAEAIENEGAQR